MICNDDLIAFFGAEIHHLIGFALGEGLVTREVEAIGASIAFEFVFAVTIEAWFEQTG